MLNSQHSNVPVKLARISNGSGCEFMLYSIANFHFPKLVQKIMISGVSSVPYTLGTCFAFTIYNRNELLSTIHEIRNCFQITTARCALMSQLDFYSNFQTISWTVFPQMLYCHDVISCHHYKRLNSITHNCSFTCFTI